jgi:hypothetical protein
MFINESIYKDNLNDDSTFDPVKLSPIRIPVYKEEDDDIESQLIIKIKKNNIFINFLLYLLSFLTCIIFEFKKCSPKFVKKNIT